MKNGVTYKSEHFSFTLDAVMCDAPTKAFVRSTKYFNGYHGCDRCVQFGTYIDNRMTYPEIDSDLRSDEDFRNRTDEQHHTGVSPFESIPNLDMIKTFPHDYIHLLCLGVVKKVLVFLSSAPIPYKVSQSSLKILSTSLVSLRQFITSDFSRKPSFPDDIPLWKATEFRLVGLYLIIPFLFQEAVHPHLFNTLYSLYCLMQLICHKDLCKSYASYCKELAIVFF